MNFNKKAIIAAAGADAVEPPPSHPWELDYAGFDGILPMYVGTWDSLPTSYDFNADGTRLYIAGATRDVVYEKSLATPYSPGTAGIVKYSIFTEVPNATKIDINPGGNKLIVTDDTANIYYYTLTVPHDFSTAVYNGVVSFSGYVTTIKRARIQESGSFLFILDNNNKIRRFSLSTPYDISTYSLDSATLTISSGLGTASSFCFRNSTTLYVTTNLYLLTYSISYGSAWDLASMSYNAGFTASLTNGLDIIATPIRTTTINTGSPTLITDYNGTNTSGSLSLPNIGITGSVISLFTTDSLVVYMLINTGTERYITGTRITTTSGTLPLNSFQGYYLGNVEGNVTSIQFSADGTKLFYIGSSIDNLRVLNLTSPWQIYSAVPSSDTLIPPSTTSAIYSIYFKPDGTRLYLADQTYVYEYSLTTAWDITTASRTFYDFNINANTGSPARSITFSADGTKFFVQITSWFIYQYPLGIPYDLGTINTVNRYTFNTDTRYISTTTTGYTIRFDSTGKKFYRIDTTSDIIYCYQLNTAYDLSTIKNNYIMGVGLEETSPYSVYFNSSGTVMYILGTAGDDINNYTLSTPWDLSTASFHSLYPVFTQAGTTPSSIALNSTGNKMYLLSNTYDMVYEYENSNPPYFNAPYLTYTNALYVGSQQTVPYGIALSNDDSKLYVVGTSPLVIHEYTLSTPGSLNTGTYSGNSLNLSSAVSSARDIFFGKEGTRLYVSDAGTTPKKIVQYNLSTPYDLSTATYYTSFLLPTFHSYSSIGLYFKPNGKSFYTVDLSSDMVVQYNIG